MSCIRTFKALVASAILFSVSPVTLADDNGPPSIGVVSASGCFFLSPVYEEGDELLRLDNICDAGLDEGWEKHVSEHIADAGHYQPVAMTFDRDEARSVLHGEPSTDPTYPPQFNLKANLPYLVSLAQKNEADYLLVVRADGNRLNNGFWMNHSGIIPGALMRKGALYYSAEMILVDAAAGKRVKASSVKGPYTGDLSSIPHIKLDKQAVKQGLTDPGTEARAATLAKLDEVARKALGRTVKKVVRKPKKRRKR